MTLESADAYLNKLRLDLDHNTDGTGSELFRQHFQSYSDNMKLVSGNGRPFCIMICRFENYHPQSMVMRWKFAVSQLPFQARLDLLFYETQMQLVWLSTSPYMPKSCSA